MVDGLRAFRLIQAQNPNVSWPQDMKREANIVLENPIIVAKGMRSQYSVQGPMVRKSIMWYVLMAFAMTFDFIEIGTSNFNTLLQENAGVGLSVEALRIYLADLPDNPNVIKVNNAVLSDSVVASQPFIPFFFVDPASISKYKLPWWLKGCNSAHEPHREAMSVLKHRGLEFLMETTNVKTTSYLKLLETYDVKNVSIVKLDMEGYEFPVLEELLSACKTTRVCPSSIMFETKHMKYRDASRLSKILSSMREMFDCNGSRGKLKSQINDGSDLKFDAIFPNFLKFCISR
mgnify:CR=1 FL=1